MPPSAAPSEPILEPDLPIVDPHHHLWDRPKAMVAALAGSSHGFSRVIERVPRYLLDELNADLNSGHNIRATVYMECGAFYRADGPPQMRCVGETEFVTGVAAMSASGVYGEARACAAMVGHADLTLGAPVAEVLEAHIAAAGGRFRGIRHAAASDPDPEVLGPLHGRPAGLYLDNTFREGFARLEPLGLSFDAWMLEPQLLDLLDLARAFPSTQIILDHVGTPLGLGAYRGRREERFGLWRDIIRAPGSAAQCRGQVGRTGHGVPGLRVLPRRPARSVVAARRRVEALHRDLHRGLRRGAMHVREQLPGRSGQLQLRRAVERLQGHRRRLFGR